MGRSQRSHFGLTETREKAVLQRARQRGAPVPAGCWFQRIARSAPAVLALQELGIRMAQQHLFDRLGAWLNPRNNEVRDGREKRGQESEQRPDAKGEQLKPEMTAKLARSRVRHVA